MLILNLQPSSSPTSLLESSTLRSQSRSRSRWPSNSNLLDHVSFHFISFRFVSFRFISFRFISFRFVSFRFISFQAFAFIPPPPVFACFPFQRNDVILLLRPNAAPESLPESASCLDGEKQKTTRLSEDQQIK